MSADTDVISPDCTCLLLVTFIVVLIAVFQLDPFYFGGSCTVFSFFSPIFM